MHRDSVRLITDGEVKPGVLAAVIASNKDGRKSVYPMKWGIRLEAKKLEVTKITETESETAGKNDAYKEDWYRRRCIIPCSYYFEWEHKKNSVGEVAIGGRYALQPCGQTVTWIAGLYRIVDGLPYFIILTRTAPPEISHINERMPVMLPDTAVNDWINPSADPVQVIKRALLSVIAEKAD